MISLWFTDEVPFRVVHNHGLVRDEHGKKMSKSFGNVIDPVELIERYGADATRFALLRSAAPGTDVPMAEEWVEGAKRFTNKLWNAGRFALSNLGGVGPGPLGDPGSWSIEDRWILSRLAQVQRSVEEGYEGYDWPVVARSLYHFVWDEFADWYLEAIKIRIYGEDEAAAATARHVLASVLDRVLHLLHPLMPFVTEALWRALTGAPGGSTSLMVSDWPEGPVAEIDEDAERDFAVIRDLVTELNRFRSQNSIAPSARFELVVASQERDLLERHRVLVESLAGLSALQCVDALEELPGTSTVVFGSGQGQVNLAGLIDVAAELARLGKELDRTQAELSRVDGKLANEAFVERAPAEVVAKERERREELARNHAQLSERRDALAQLG